MRYGSWMALFLVIVLVRGVAHAQNAAPVVNDDMFAASTDTLAVAAPGVLDNDTDADGDSLVVFVVAEPTNGTLTLHRDGSFTYTPNPGFTGTDSFSYLAEEVVLASFVVDSTASNATFMADLSTQVGSDSDSDMSNIAGAIALHLRTEVQLYDEVHVSAMDLRLIDPMSLSFSFGLFGRLDVDTDADSLRLTLLQPGPPVTTFTPFVQPNNEMGISGILNLSASGVIGTAIEDGPQPLNAIARGDIGGFLSLEDDTLSLELPLEFTGMFEVEGNNVDVSIEALVLASAPTPPAPRTSNVATVTIQVDDVGTATEAAADLPERFALDQNYPNPFNPVTTIAYALPVPEHVTVQVFDMLGREVATLVDARQPAGRQEVQFDAGTLPSGVYVYQLRAGAFTAVKMLTVLK